jgi:OOP family OmpA-OmpF porin
MTPTTWLRPGLLAFLLLLLAVPARAQDTPRTDRTFSPQLFHPAVGPDEFLSVEPAQPLGHRNYAVRLWFNYARGPLAILSVNNQTGTVGGARALLVRDLISADLTGAIGVANRLQFGVGLPLALYQTGDDFNYSLNGVPQDAVRGARGFALGDPWVDIKVRLFGKDRGFNLAVSGMATFPASLATPKNFGGDTGFSAGGRLLAGLEYDRWRLGVQVGYNWRQNPSRLFSTTVGSELRYAAAFAYDVIPKRRLAVMVEVKGHTTLDGPDIAETISNIDATVLEVDVAAKLRVGRYVFLTAGVGTGVLRGVSAPVARGILGVTFSNDLRDRDHDGVPDIEDKCLTTAEDRDNFQDKDGCPEPDNDRDGILDVNDRCPNMAEDFDEFEDEDGCPEADNDHDGIPDLNDPCPLDKEDRQGSKPTDGCPLDKTDADGDGVPDFKDKCADQAEDKDGFQDEDGCPEPDNDQDGYADKDDKCPDEAEDFDQFEDEDGCPEPDNDHDGVFDDKDRCPNEAETINGVRDEDGCADSGPPSKVQLVGDEIILLDKVNFEGSKATLTQRSSSLLDQLALTLVAHPELKQIRVEGHTDNQGDAESNRRISQERAEAVKSYLVKKGVAAKRLEAKGVGPDRPVADNNTTKGREANRRIEFHVTERQR